MCQYTHLPNSWTARVPTARFDFEKYDFNSDYKLEVYPLSRSFSGIVLKSLLTGVEVVFAPLRGRLYDLSVDITRDVLVSDAVLVVSITS